MLLRPIRTRLRRYLHNQDGTVTVEFVILFPAIVMLVLTFVVLSTYIATIGDVQQVASDLTRQSLRYVDMGETATDICAGLQSEVLPGLVREFAFAAESRITGVDCVLGADRSTVAVSVTYDLNGTYIQSFGRTVGFDVIEIVRTSEMRL